MDTTNGYVQITQYNSDRHYYIIGQFKNPLGAITQSSWRMEVYDTTNAIILQQNSDIIETSTMSSITSNSAVRDSDATTVAISSNYTLTFTPSSRMLSSSKIKLFFPYDQVKYNNSTSCFSGNASLPCVLTETNRTHFQTEITQQCNISGECAAGTEISFVLTNAVNPSFIADPITSSVIIQTINTELSGNPIIDQTTGSISFTPSLTPGTLTNVTFFKDPSTNLVGEASSYNVTFTIATPIDAGGKVKLTFPLGAVYKTASTPIV